VDLSIADGNSRIGLQSFWAAQARCDLVEITRWTHQEIEYQHSLAWTRNQMSNIDWQASWEEGYNFETTGENQVTPAFLDKSSNQIYPS